MKRSTMKLAAGVALLALLGACESTPKESGNASTTPVNTVCPVGGEPVDKTVTTSFNGKTVAFCCQGCEGKFNKMTDADKSAALAKAK